MAASRWSRGFRFKAAHKPKIYERKYAQRIAVCLIAANGWRLAEVPHSRNFGFEQELSCDILANRCYAYVPTCLAGISFGIRTEIFN